MAGGKHSQRILIIDDDPVITKLAGDVLLSRGYEVLITNDAPTGLEIAIKQAPDLIILDVMMPVINGFNICRLMKTQEECRHIPIVLLTSRSKDEDRKIGEEVGADAYLAKPLNTPLLLSTIERFLGPISAPFKTS